MEAPAFEFQLPGNWLATLDATSTILLLKNLAVSHLRECPMYGATLSKLILSDRWDELVAFEVPYEEVSVSEAIHLRQALGFFTKLEVLPLGVDKEAVAFSKFLESEALCKQTNLLFRLWRSGAVSFRPDVVRRLYCAQRKIHKVLGKAPKFGELHMRFGPGATTRTKKSNASWQRKFAHGISCSYELYYSGYLPSVLREIPHWTAALSSSFYIDDEGWLCEQVPVDVCHGRLQFVPKSAKTFRSIVVEPSLNVFVQQGILRDMERRLFSAGINLRSQEINKSRARVGSIDGSLATLDLSSASDTVSRELVRFLLPEPWYDLLDSCRTGSVVYGEHTYYLEKFSSMGNSFTFPLESLIFWALATVSDANATVYGDDIVCDTKCVAQVVEDLTHCGFSVNLEKSFWEGPFRESCGGDYLKGIDIRPYYQKHLVSGQTLYSLHNYYKRELDNERAQVVLGFIPESLRLFGPEGYGDGCLIGHPWTPRISPKLLKKGYGGVSFDIFATSARTEPSLYPGDWVTPLYSIYDAGEPGLKAPILFRGGRPVWSLPGVSGYRRLSIYTFIKP